MISRRSTRALSAIAGSILLLSSFAPAIAQETHYSDVPPGAYYEAAAAALLDLGALDRNESRLRPGDLATRAEMVKLLISVHGEQLMYPGSSSFNDVSTSAWYYPYFEAAANVGWVKGDNDCYQRTRPCTARPNDRVNRAEAAALLNRSFNLEHTGAAPQFSDNSQDQWYYTHIQTAADHCILQGDAGTGRVRPAALMNRAEMVVMFHRAYMNMQYGEDCGTPTTPRVSVTSVSATSSNRLRVTFSDDIDLDRAEDESRYSVVRVSGGGTVGVRTATAIDDRTVDLDLSESLSSGVQYNLTARNLLSDRGVLFTGSGRFTFTGTVGHLSSATAVSGNRIRLTFDADVARSRAEEEFRYNVTLVGGTETIGIQNAAWLDDRTVELTLSNSMRPNSPYRISVQNIETDTGVVFSDSASFQSMVAVTGNITSVSPLSSTRLRLTFNTDLDPVRAEQSGRYKVSDTGHELVIRTASQIDARTVELNLIESMRSQRAYTVSVQDMLTTQGATFSDSETFVSTGSTVNFRATLTGGQEIPPRISIATGTGTFMLTSTGLQYDITLRGLSGSVITAAHFHTGNTGTSGPPVKDIVFSGNRATGTWTDMTTTHRNALLEGGIYVNIHTPTYPDGEIRGQVLAQ